MRGLKADPQVLAVAVTGDPSPAAVVKESRRGSDHRTHLEHPIVGSIAAPVIGVYRREGAFQRTQTLSMLTSVGGGFALK